MTRTSIQDLFNIRSLNTSESSTPDNVLVWLENIDPCDAPPAIDLGENRDLSFDAFTQQIDCFDVLPYTPQRHVTAQSPAREYPSPTNASFTDNSIFDQPFAPRTRYLNTHNDELFSYSSETSVAPSDCNEVHTGRSQVVGLENITKSEPKDTTDIEVDHDLELINRCEPVIHRESGETKILEAEAALECLTLIWVTSCLQCTLANLPCSRTMPACSRCVRAGCGDVCLLQRRKLNSERVLGDMIGNLMPIPLHQKGQDREIAERKRILSAQLLEAWQHEMDRKNWVLPFNDGKLSGFRVRGNRMPFVPTHPGEGMGRVTPQMVLLA